jgi:hypothetical protein
MYIDLPILLLLLLVIASYVARILYLSERLSRKEKIVWYTIGAAIILFFIIWGVIEGRAN